MDGRDLPRPVNYWMARVDAARRARRRPTRRPRPFIVIDPRAGHGPGHRRLQGG